MAIIRKAGENKCWLGCGGKGTLVHYWWECKLLQTLWRFLKKLKIKLPNDPAIPLLGILPEEMKTLTQKDISPQCSLQHYLQLPRHKNTPSAFSGWMDKETVIYIHSGILSRYKKQGNPTICDNMDGSWKHYAQWNKDKEIPKLYDLIYMWNLKDQNKQNTKFTEKENGFVITRGGIGETEN